MTPEDQQWVEAEQWLAYHYPEYRWKAWHSGEMIIIKQYNYDTDTIHMGCAPQSVFREWVSRTDFDYAMNHLAINNNLIHFTDTISKHKK